jgi:uncharacterized protein YjiS (DUF1127 family)
MQTLSSSACVNGTALPRRGQKQETAMSTMTIQSKSQSKSSGAFGRVAGSITRWVRALARYFDRRAAIKELRELDDRALHDIGLSRCNIERELRGRARPDVTRFL